MSGQHSRQAGAVLLISLVVIMLITVLAVTGVRMSIGGLRGAVNEELRVDAMHRAQSLVDGILAIPGNTAVVGTANELNCLPTMAGCARNNLSLPDMAPDGYEPLVLSGTTVAVQRLAPEQAPPPRVAGYSAVKFQSAAMEVQTRYDETSSGWGQAALTEGVSVIVPMPGG